MSIRFVSHHFFFFDVRFSSYHFNILFVFFIGLSVGFSFIVSSPLGLTSGLSFSPSRLIFTLVPILKLGDDISILLF